MYKNNDLGEKEDKENAATKISLWKLLKINNCEIYTISLCSDKIFVLSFFQ